MGAHHDHHGHDHAGHSHSLPRRPSVATPESRARDSRRLKLAVGITAVLFVCELVGGLLSHSLALVSDAGHMLSDIFAQGLALGAIVLAARPADSRRTFGWHRIEILAALANGILLGLLSGALMWQAYRRIGTPVEVHTGLMMIIAAAGLVANLLGAWLLHGAQNLNVRGAYLHVISDTVSSVAVLVGGAAMYFAKGLYFIDPILSILIGLFVLWGAVRLVREAVDILLETVPRELDRDRVTSAIGAVRGVVEVHDMHIWSITSGMCSMSAHVVVRIEAGQSQDDLLRNLHEVLQREFQICHSTLQLEPIGFDHVGTVCADA
ncbi:MAG: cation diffusion facilitator family transporter [Polyangia bacterium]